MVITVPYTLTYSHQPPEAQVLALLLNVLRKARRFLGLHPELALLSARVDLRLTGVM
jgi:hypothetical protein